MKHKNFTLIELLVVIAIIGVLASLILPTLGKARNQSREALSKNNLKQIYLGLMIYADDNDNFIPEPTNTGGWPNELFWSSKSYEAMTGITFDRSSWPNAKQQMWDSSYVDVMYCPIQRANKGPLEFDDIHQAGRSDYGLNKYFYDTYTLTEAQTSGKIEPMISPINHYTNPFIHRSTLDETNNTNINYDYGNGARTIALFINGNVGTMSVTYGASIDSYIFDRNDFE
ncbi:prepilin-type N-terminal cleavage/methylation domain-containing protein [Lentisphaera marina]|uniref:prepilin-type N-terminal cleavage/methylation domain-containing protein n=1 Tax=Lentisphaera marina TaxID=1111041 RepID=UPI0023660788|nr:prepilin-type N-terminal cleavage/methylation domain-containing protein [Lentisphaera marina]MDD7986547.1 prepilin-type N-terminal cleavage/methylation domain-containing protein [Lentisphaera marina]